MFLPLFSLLKHQTYAIIQDWLFNSIILMLKSIDFVKKEWELPLRRINHCKKTLSKNIISYWHWVMMIFQKKKFFSTFFLFFLSLNLGNVIQNMCLWKLWNVVTPLLWVFAFFLKFACVYYFFAGKSSNSPSFSISRCTKSYLALEFFIFLTILF